MSAATMTVNAGGNGAEESSLPNYKVMRVGDVAFEGHTSKEFAYGRFVVNSQTIGIMSPRFSALRPKRSRPISFWRHYINNERVMRNVLACSTKKGTMMNELVYEDLFKRSIPVPSEAEQELIGGLLDNLDNLITLHQRKRALL